MFLVWNGEPSLEPAHLWPVLVDMAAEDVLTTFFHCKSEEIWWRTEEMVCPKCRICKETTWWCFLIYPMMVIKEIVYWGTERWMKLGTSSSFFALNNTFIFWKRLYIKHRATIFQHRFSAFWLRSKCSICSYQLNIWYVPHWGTSILNWFLNTGEMSGACSALATGWPGIAVHPGSAHFPPGKKTNNKKKKEPGEYYGTFGCILFLFY